MTLKQLLLTVLFATLVLWLTWVMVLFQLDPTASGFLGLSLFYASLFFSLLGTFFLATFGWRKIFNKFSLEFRLVGVSFRQSFFFALLVVSLLFLASHGLLTWWNIIILVAAVTLLEFFFLSYKRSL